jgi:aspartate racemase
MDIGESEPSEKAKSHMPGKINAEMKKIGLIGGIGPESSIAYYRMIIRRFQEILNTNDYPEILINSINMTGMLNCVYNNQLETLVDFLVVRINALVEAGVDYVAIASNTPHLVFEQLAQKVNVPLISIVEETCKAIRDKKLQRVGLFGTRSTMTSGFYYKAAGNYGINVLVPGTDQQEYIHEKYMNELIFNRIVPETKEELIVIVRALKAKESIEGLILGGTELPLILNQSDFGDIEIFDTTKIHVESIVAKMIA